MISSPGHSGVSPVPPRGLCVVACPEHAIHLVGELPEMSAER
jgi:hypothetical protein